mmetsp:Transcript_35057/g.84818  ORF Transcript_35057/g.84818 Transcript_35057/m.84818 type:complete len:576 (-) Transcript_35057:113-1840(-)
MNGTSGGGGGGGGNSSNAHRQLTGPSAERRAKLIENDVEDRVPIVSNLFQLDIYLNASDKLYDSFETFRANDELDGAYIYGKRYVKFCIEQMTSHDYFQRGKYKSRSVECIKRSSQVLTKLEDVVAKMDVEEEEKERRRLELIRKQEEERLKRQREKEQKQIEELQKRIEAQKKSSSVSKPSEDESSNGADQVESSAMAKLHLLTRPSAPVATATPTLPKGTSSSSSSSTATTNHSVWTLPPVEVDGQNFPPPLLPPSSENDGTTSNLNSPPSYTSVVEASSFFGPGKDGPISNGPLPAYDQVVTKKNKVRPLPQPSEQQQQKQKPRPPKKVSIRQFVADMRSRHVEFQREGKIQVWPLKTYQGRTSGSTNGCTVISACVASKHMESRRGLDDNMIQSVIDKECVPLLRSIRHKLDLGAASLIIPSDVHDYLVDQKWLYQHKFAGAAGGNIVDPNHSGELLNLLRGEPGKTAHLKAAATLFFREHVVSIVKFPQGDDGENAVYDMVDSLPTLNGKGSRTRCHSLEAFRVHLAKYCTQKLSDSNLKYIEKNPWDDSMADFDPRVFQAFVWMDFPKQ